MEIMRIKLTDLEMNRGQVAGLPSNPRQWGKKELQDLVQSIKDTPELLEARGLIVWPHEGKYVIMGGNMRFSALREMNAVDAPCYVLPADTDMDKLREIVIKDNGAFGSWDYDMLANEWDDLPLSDWGVPAWNTKDLECISPDELTDTFSLPSGEKQPFQQMTFTLADEQAEQIKQALEEAKCLEEYKGMVTYGNCNSNGNAISYIIEQWIESRKYN